MRSLDTPLVMRLRSRSDDNEIAETAGPLRAPRSGPWPVTHGDCPVTGTPGCRMLVSCVVITYIGSRRRGLERSPDLPPLVEPAPGAHEPRPAKCESEATDGYLVRFAAHMPALGMVPPRRAKRGGPTGLPPAPRYVTVDRGTRTRHSSRSLPNYK